MSRQISRVVITCLIGASSPLVNAGAARGQTPSAFADLMPARRKEYGDRMAPELGLGFAYATYQFVASSTPAGDIWLLATGYDIFGKKADKDDKWIAAVNIGLAVLQFGAQARLDVELATSPNRINRLGTQLKGRPLTISVRNGPMNRPSSGARDNSSGGGTNRAIPASAPPLTNSCPRDVAPPPPPLPPMPNHPRPFQPLGDVLDISYLGATAKFKVGGKDYSQHMQELNNGCALGTDNMLYEKATGERIRERDSAYALKEMGIFDIAGLQKAVAEGKLPGIAGGMPDEVSRQYVEILGGREVGRLDLPLKTMKMLMDRGYVIKNKLIWRDATGKVTGAHAVGIDEIHLDANGDVSSVDFFDPGPGRVVNLPACDYQRILSVEGETGPNTSIRKYDKIQ